jgi:hypothetical protein
LEERVGAYLRATARYDEVIRPYPGHVLLVRACFRSEFIGYDVDPWLGWKDLVANLEVHEASGNHLSVLKAPAVDSVAAPLRSVLMALRPPASVRGVRLSSAPPSGGGPMSASSRTFGPPSSSHDLAGRG